MPSMKWLRRIERRAQVQKIVCRIAAAEGSRLSCATGRMSEALRDIAVKA